jgi:hypothetical protein
LDAGNDICTIGLFERNPLVAGDVFREIKRKREQRAVGRRSGASALLLEIGTD